MGWLGGFLIASALGAIALYFLFPGVALRFAMGLARRIGRLHLREVEVDGHRLPYLEGGQGEPLLLLHGFGGNKDHWTMIAPHLTPHFHVYAPDLPGFGDATRDTGRPMTSMPRSRASRPSPNSSASIASISPATPWAVTSRRTSPRATPSA